MRDNSSQKSVKIERSSAIGFEKLKNFSKFNEILYRSVDLEGFFYSLVFCVSYVQV